MSSPRRLLDQPPLTPGPDQARSALRRELLHPEYHERSLLQQVLDWLDRHLGGALDAASGASGASTLVALLLLAALVVVLGLLVSRLRRTPRAAPVGAVLSGERVSAAAHITNK